LQEGLPQFHRPQKNGPRADDAHEAQKDAHESKHPPAA
jgi:hypothetical protein